MLTKNATRFFTAWYVIGIVTTVFAAEAELPCEISKERSLFSQFHAFVPKVKQYDLDTIDKLNLEYKKKAEYRDRMKQLYTEFIQEQKYYTVLEDKLFFARKHLELCNVSKLEADESRAHIKIEYPKQKAAMHPWYTKLRFIGWLLKKPLTEEFLNLKMQYRYVKYGEELKRYLLATDHNNIDEPLKTAVGTEKMKYLFNYYNTLLKSASENFWKHYAGKNINLAVSDRPYTKNPYLNLYAAKACDNSKNQAVQSNDALEAEIREIASENNKQYWPIWIVDVARLSFKDESDTAVVDTPELRNMNKKFARGYAYLFKHNKGDRVYLDVLYESIYLYYLQEKIDAIKDMNAQPSLRTWPQWLLSLFILSHNTTSKHEKYQNQLKKYGAYFRLLGEKHASLMQSSDSAKT